MLTFRKTLRRPVVIIAAISMLGLIETGVAAPKDKTVFVCACLGNRSCKCMSMAMYEGPCACGPKGGPPMKAVTANSDWAKANRKALSN